MSCLIECDRCGRMERVQPCERPTILEMHFHASGSTPGGMTTVVHLCPECAARIRQILITRVTPAGEPINA